MFLKTENIFKFIRSFVFLIFFSSALFAESFQPENIPKSRLQESEVPLPPEVRQELVNVLNALYLRTRVPGDPDSPPDFVFLAMEDAAAFVRESERHRIYWSLQFLLRAKSEDFIGAVEAHELRHFHPDQIRRRKEMGYRKATLLNEWDSDLAGIAERVLRIGLVDSSGEPEPASLNIEAIIEEFAGLRGYSATHPNPKHVASLFRSAFAKERKRRRFPAITDNSAIQKHSKVILEALNKIPKILVVRRTVEFKRSWEINLNPFHSLITTVENLDRLTALPETPITLSEIESNLRTLHEEFLFLTHTASGTKESEIADRYLDTLPENIFEKLDQALARIDGFKNPTGQYLCLAWRKQIGALAASEKYFRSFEESTNELKDIFTSILDFTEFGLLNTFSRFNIRRRAVEIEKRSRKHPFECLSVAGYLQTDKNAGKEFSHLKNAVTGAILTNLRSINPVEAIRQKQISQQAIIFLDATMGSDHLISKDERLKLLAAFSDPEFISLQIQLTKSDRKLILEQIKKYQMLEDENAPRYVSQFARSAIHIIPMGTFDEVFSQMFEQQMKRRKAKSGANLKAEVLSIENQRKSSSQTSPYGSYLLFQAAVPIFALPRIEDDQIDNLGLWLQYREVASREVAQDFDLNRIEEMAKKFSALDAASKVLQDDALMISRISAVVNGDLSRLPKISHQMKTMILQNPIGMIFALTRMVLPPGQENPLQQLPLSFWNEVTEGLTRGQFLQFCMSEFSTSPELFAGILNGIYLRAYTLLEQNQLSLEEANFVVRRLAALCPFNVPSQNAFVELTVRRALAASATERDEILKGLSPETFESQAAYLKMVDQLLNPDIESIQQNLFSRDTRSQTLSDFLGRVKNSLAGRDELLLYQIFERIAERVAAVPDERPLFTIDLKGHERFAAEGVEFANTLLSSYDDLSRDDRWHLLQWFRGKEASLRFIIRRNIERALRERKIFVSAGAVESYLRTRFESLSPLIRATVFQLALDGKDGLLHDETDREKIIEEIFKDVPRDIRSTVEDLFEAAEYALPPTLKNLLIAVAYAESGRHGSPEEALTSIFIQMGMLIKKFGQNLALDSNIPESYRKSLERLWDEVPHDGWWKIYSRFERIAGPVSQTGIRITRIRNSGTTEVAVEIETPEREHYLIQIPHEALQVSKENDFTDLQRFVARLVEKKNKDKYSFLKLLVVDSERTARAELDPLHKPVMSKKMKDIYFREVVRRGGKMESDSAVLPNGWRIQGQTYSELKTSAGKTITIQKIAPGIPLKDLRKQDLELFEEVTAEILGIENAVQNDLQANVIDKDRMPGKFLVDVNTKTITFLDHGQAKEISSEIRNLRDPFIGGALAASPSEMAHSFETFGFRPGMRQKFSLWTHLIKTSAGSRPLQALHWIESNHIPAPEQEEKFFDLVHVVRAKTRLAQWADSRKNPLIANEWSELASAALRNQRGPLNCCILSMQKLGKLLH
ncbi:MAG: hypothetical protein JWQ35_1786 [Bacteriovoracaceae bacterium]|nr:hypothetical protein [Bacteriovoracaceae bacterium]